MIENNIIPKVSVGIAVYNVEKYLTRCLDSMMKQTLDEMEIIIVDDGSSDNCATICDRYAEKDGRFRVIHKKNGGLASARQTALEVATGEYFCACDGDDWVEPSMYEKLYKEAKNTGADVVMCDFVSEYGNNVSKLSYYGKEVPLNNSQVIDAALKEKFPYSVWSKMFKREIFEKYSLSWEPGINQGEDFLITLKILQHPVRIVYLPENLYHYRRMLGENSYTNRITLSSYEQLLRIHELIEKWLKPERYSKGINHNLINIAFAGLRVVDGMTSEYYKKTTTNKLSVVALLGDFTLKSLVILWSKIFGYNSGRKICKSLYKLAYR